MSPKWKEYGERDDQFAFVWKYWSDWHNEMYMSGRKHFTEKNNGLCGEVEWNCLDTTCEEEGKEEECDSSFCYDPCNMDIHTCTFNYKQGDEMKTEDCNEALRDRSWWETERADPVWGYRVDKDQQWLYVFYYLDNYHFGDMFDMIEDDYKYYDYDMDDHFDSDYYDEYHNDKDDDWSDMEDGQDWQDNGEDWQEWEEPEIEDEPCDEELVCDFEQCPEEYVWEGLESDSCWKETCANECGEELCTLWHATDYVDGNWVWADEECPLSREEQLKANAEETAQNAAFLRQSFNGTLTTAFEAFCPAGTCIPQADPNQVGKDIAEQTQVGTSLDSVYENPEAVNTISTALDESSAAFGIDVSAAKALVNAGSSQKANEIISGVLENLTSSENEEGGWLSGWLGSWTEGDKNEGSTRRGRRN